MKRYSGYTYTTLMQEDAHFLRLVNILDHGQDVEGGEP